MNPLTQVMSGVMLVLVLGLAGSGWMLKRQIAANAALESQADEWEQSLAEMARDYTDQEQRARDAEARMVASQAAQRRIRRQAQALQGRLAALERENSDVAAYMALDMPDDLFERLRADPGVDPGDDGQAGAAGLPAGAEGGADAGGQADAGSGAVGNAGR